MSKANEIQVGGTHYQGSLQHWDMMWRLGCGWEYYMAAASKYLSRAHKTDKDGEGGVLGLGKAIHYGDKLAELVESGDVPRQFRTTTGRRLNIDSPEGPYNQCVNVEDLTKQFVAANHITNPLQAEALLHLFSMKNLESPLKKEPTLYTALALMRKLHDQLTGRVDEAPAEATGSERAQAAQARAAEIVSAQIAGAATPDYVDQAKDI